MIVSDKHQGAIAKASIRKSINDCHNVAVTDALPVLD